MVRESAAFGGAVAGVIVGLGIIIGGEAVGTGLAVAAAGVAVIVVSVGGAAWTVARLNEP